MIIIMNVNVMKIYDHVWHIKLFHNLKKMILNWIIQWIKSFLKKRQFSIIFEKKKHDKQNKRRDFAKILCFVYIVFVFQRESAKCMRTIEKKNNSHRIRWWCECVDIQHKHRKKLQNFRKITRNLYDVISTSWSDFLFNKIWIDSFK